MAEYEVNDVLVSQGFCFRKMAATVLRCFVEMALPSQSLYLGARICSLEG